MVNNDSMDKVLEKAQTLIEALPYIQSFNGKRVVVKYGGSAMIDENLKYNVIKDVALLKLIGLEPIIVHGGGKEISAWLNKIGKESEFINGLRVTDEETLDVAEMVLSKVNKSLVAMMQKLGLKAVGISGKDAAMYMVFQVIGAFIGSALLALLVSGLAPEGTTTGANTCAGGVMNGLIAEIVLTFIFVLVVLGTTDSKVGAGNFAGLAIGLSLILIHLVGIHYTGTSVNPARSIAPAVFQGGEALSQLWVFIVGPFIGAALSAIVWKVLSCEKCAK